MEAIIFDLDGTLIDTEKYYRIAWPKALARFGYDMSDEQALFIRSLGRPFSLRFFKDTYGEEFDYEKIHGYRKEIMNGIIAENGIELKPGAREILEYLNKRGVVTALATANPKERTERYLKSLGLWEYFSEVICADMVERGKPAPDIYQYACNALRLEPHSVYAVEDSPNGVESAYMAGCRVIFVPDQTPMEERFRDKVAYCKESLLEIRDLF